MGIIFYRASERICGNWAIITDRIFFGVHWSLANFCYSLRKDFPRTKAIRINSELFYILVTSHRIRPDFSSQIQTPSVRRWVLNLYSLTNLPHRTMDGNHHPPHTVPGLKQQFLFNCHLGIISVKLSSECLHIYAKNFPDSPTILFEDPKSALRRRINF